MGQQPPGVQLLVAGLRTVVMCVPFLSGDHIDYIGHVLTERLYLFLLAASSGRYSLTGEYDPWSCHQS
jgi:hypothetical protein